jgi:pyrophosphatase PpaX
VSSARSRPALLFDLDGTLIDSIDLIRQSYAHTLRIHRGQEHAEVDFLAGLGRPLRWQFSQWTEDPAEIEEMIRTYRAHNLEHHDHLVTGFGNLTTIVARLAEQGRRLGIVTSKQRAGTLRGLERCGFQSSWFDALVAADDVQNHKPHPEPVQRAAAALGLDPKQTIMIGDSPHDLSSGRTAGAATAAVAWGPFPRSELLSMAPDFWLETPEDLERILG